MPSRTLWAPGRAASRLEMRFRASPWEAPEDAPLLKTRLHATHRELGARMVPFGGWDMPVWYTSNSRSTGQYARLRAFST
jgi:hypothetical protein